MTTLHDLLSLDARALRAIVDRGHLVDPDGVAGRQYLGVDLSLPPLLSRLLWKTFRKTFHRDRQDGEVRGWNVRMEQHGVDGPAIPMRKRDGGLITFGHYRLRSAQGERFPGGWSGASFLDYHHAGNRRFDPAALGWCPLVAVNEGDMDLLLGWEVFRVGPLFVNLPLFWALRVQGPVEEVVPVPRPAVSA